MASNPPHDMPRIVPHLFYDDLDAAINWLVEAFGFVVRVRLTDKDEKLVHGELEVEDSLVMIGLARENDAWESPRTLGRIHQRLFIYVDDVDAHYERAQKAGAHILYPPEDQFYGDRVYECVGPEGHRWKFAEHLEDVDLNVVKRPGDEV